MTILLQNDGTCSVVKENLTTELIYRFSYVQPANMTSTLGLQLLWGFRETVTQHNHGMRCHAKLCLLFLGICDLPIQSLLSVLILDKNEIHKTFMFPISGLYVGATQVPGHVSSRSLSKAARLPSWRCSDVAPRCRPESPSTGLAGK